MVMINFKVSNQTPFYKHYYQQSTHEPRTSEFTINKIFISNDLKKYKDNDDDFFPLLDTANVKSHYATYTIV